MAQNQYMEINGGGVGAWTMLCHIPDNINSSIYNKEVK